MRKPHAASMVSLNDIYALNAVIEAERTDSAATPGILRDRLALSSAATTRSRVWAGLDRDPAGAR